MSNFEEMKQEVIPWMEKKTGEPFPQPGASDIQASLKDGVYLCKLANALRPGAIKKFSNPAKMPFKMMENIGFFLTAIQSNHGIPGNEMFMTVDLFEDKNINQVLICLSSLKRKIG